jgi:tryptophanyl-tRNA synthetase
MVQLKAMTKPVILTGLRANNELHLGNYLGALLPMIDMANKHAGEYQINLFVPDLHSFTTPIDHSQLQAQIMNNLKVFVAAGLNLDNPDIHIYRQSFIPAHSELAVILGNFTQMGELSRMTQFKDKSQNSQVVNEEQREYIRKNMPSLAKLLGYTIEARVGLFTYPMLMAADILLYGAEYVPVGDDQTQHLEFTRDIAQRMNTKFGNLFTVPKPVNEQHKFFGKDQGLRIRDLLDPTKKMSKSDETGKGVIFLTDSPKEAGQKIMSAATDSLGKVAHDYDAQPGISNLLDIYKLLGGEAGEFIGQNQYGPLKETVAKKISEFLGDFHAKLNKVDEPKLLNKLETSEAQMNKQANHTLNKVQKAVGLR